MSSPGGAAHLLWSPLCSGEDATSRGRVTRGQVPGRVSRARHTRQPVPARVHTDWWSRDTGTWVGVGERGHWVCPCNGIVQRQNTAPWQIFQSCEEDPSKSKKTFNVTNYNQRRFPFAKENIHCWCLGSYIAVKFKIQISSCRSNCYVIKLFKSNLLTVNQQTRHSCWSIYQHIRTFTFHRVFFM